MVYAFIIHTVGSKEVSIPYYKVFTCYKVDSKTCDESEEALPSSNFETTEPEETATELPRKFVPNISSVIFESVSEKKELLQLVANKVHMHYCLRINQALIPVSSVDNNRKITGVFTERQLKHRGLEIVVVWQGVRGFGFTLLCSKNESILQAQATLDSIVTQLESLLKFLSDPGVAIKLVETISLVTNNFIPGGLLIFANGRMNKSLIKKLEVDLYAK